MLLRFAPPLSSMDIHVLNAYVSIEHIWISIRYAGNKNCQYFFRKSGAIFQLKPFQPSA